MQTNSAVEQSKILLDGPRVRGISPVGKEKVYGERIWKRELDVFAVLVRVHDNKGWWW